MKQTLLHLHLEFPAFRTCEEINVFFKLPMGGKLLQSCLTVFNPVEDSLPGSSVHGILQAKILEWVVISSSRGSS